jgi:tRNA pseudouridine55 synthase
MMQDNSLNGVIILNKHLGITSFGMVKKIKRIFNVKKAGHTGTLDPLATGVLPVCLGKSTRLSQFFLDSAKIYSGEFCLGVATDTYDREGKITQQGDIPENIDLNLIKEIAKKFTGEILQAPPPFSAAKHNGVPLHKLARKGIIITKEPKKITIYNFEILSYNKKFIEFKIECSKGTYIRAIANDFGKELGSCAHLYSLKREQTGPFNIKNAVELEELENIPLEKRYDYIIPHEKILNIIG